MIPAPLPHDVYQSPARNISFLGRHAPSLLFYLKATRIVFHSAWKTRHPYSLNDWADDSRIFMAACEACGIRFHLEGLEHYRKLNGPCVIVANHMSTMETFCLPGMLVPIRPAMFVLKRSLTTYPVFGRVVNAINPIVVDRQNPREDFQTVMQEGQKRLEQGISVIVFPQTTRTPDCNPAQFNSIGVKLAKKAGVPLMPLALNTSAWGTGKILKDYGAIHPEIPARFAFGHPLHIHGQGKNEHLESLEFIRWKLKAWTKK